MVQREVYQKWRPRRTLEHIRHNKTALSLSIYLLLSNGMDSLVFKYDDMNKKKIRDCH